jgi:hypothetical protein
MTLGTGTAFGVIVVVGVAAVLARDLAAFPVADHCV